MRKTLQIFLNFFEQKIFYTSFEDGNFSQLHYKFCYRHRNFENTEAATVGVLKNSQDSQENIYARTSFLIKPQASYFC